MENINGLFGGSETQETQLRIVKTPKWRFRFRNKHFSTRGCDI